jgi:hypothetical protein
VIADSVLALSSSERGCLPLTTLESAGGVPTAMKVVSH